MSVTLIHWVCDRTQWRKKIVVDETFVGAGLEKSHKELFSPNNL